MRKISLKLIPLLMLVLETACAGAQAEATPLPSPIETMLDTAAMYAGKRVVVEGYLIAHSTIHCGLDSICVLWLSTGPEGDDGVTYGQPEQFVLLGIYEKDGEPYPNTLIDIPRNWDSADIVVTSNDMAEIHLNDRVRVTGWVEVDEEGYAKVTGPDPCHDISGEERLELFETYRCPETGFTIELLDN